MLSLSLQRRLCRDPPGGGKVIHLGRPAAGARRRDRDPLERRWRRSALRRSTGCKRDTGMHTVVGNARPAPAKYAPMVARKSPAGAAAGRRQRQLRDGGPGAEPPDPRGRPRGRGRRHSRRTFLRGGPEQLSSCAGTCNESGRSSVRNASGGSFCARTASTVNAIVRMAAGRRRGGANVEQRKRGTWPNKRAGCVARQRQRRTGRGVAAAVVMIEAG